MPPFGVCDIETEGWTKFLVIGLYIDGEVTYFTSIDDFFIHLFRRRRSTTIYAHFGGKFDFLFLLEAAFEFDDVEIGNLIPRGSSIMCFDMIFSGDVKITFFDSAAFLPFSLERLTNSFDVEHKKLPYDHTKTRGVTDELLHYLKHDLMGHYEVIDSYRNWDLIRRAGPKNTMASQAIQVLRLFLEEDIHPLDEEVDVFIRECYFGGRTEIFRPFYDGPDPINCYDVNSLYPTVMRSNPFPNRFQAWTYEYNPDVMGFFDACVDVPKDMYLPPLPVVKKVGQSPKLIFPTGRFWGRWSTPELKYAESIGVKIHKTGQGVVLQDGGFIFRDFIETLYQMRLEAKHRKDKVTDILTKLLMNSCYGRFGLNKARKNLVIDDGQEGIEPYCEIPTRNGIIRIGQEDKYLDTSFSNVAIAAWVTSLARIHMHKIFMTCGEGGREVYYTDTDSMFTPLTFRDSDELGDMKLEYRAKDACFLLPKTYIANGINDEIDLKKVVMKGFDRRKIQTFTMDDFTSALEGELRALRMEIKEKESHGLLTFKRALKKGKLVMRPGASTREIRSKYDKRLIYKKNGQYFTKPIHIEE